MSLTRLRQIRKTAQKLTLLPRTGPDLYAAAEKPAEAVKGYLQILLGLAIVVFVAYNLICRWNTLPLSRIADHALALVGGGLAISAVVELAYTFFTHGPDEALDPLILGVSSFALIKISMESTKLDLSHMVSLALLALTLALLFLSRRFLLKDPNDQNVAEPVPSGRSTSQDERTGQPVAEHDVPGPQPDMVPQQAPSADA